jgi:uncharacterized integral membrane protein (TIGR00698 family)
MKQIKDFSSTVSKIFPGLLLCFILAFVAIKISNLAIFSVGNNVAIISSEILAILLGIFLGNSLKIAKIFDAGINFSLKNILALAIVLLGVKLDLKYLFNSSSSLFFIDIASVILNIAIGAIICKILKLDKNVATLLIVGNAICGSSAIIILAPLIVANQNQISTSLIISSLLGLMAIFIYPAVGKIFAIDNNIFGIWAGATVQSVPQVLATGFSFSEEAGKLATITKLIKVLLLAPTILLVTVFRNGKTVKIKEFYRCFPLFIFGFLIMVGLNSANCFDNIVFDYKTSDLLANISGFLLTATMVAIGIKTNVKSCFNASFRPFVAGFISSVLVSLLILSLLYYFQRITS